MSTQDFKIPLSPCGSIAALQGGLSGCTFPPRLQERGPEAAALHPFFEESMSHPDSQPGKRFFIAGITSAASIFIESWRPQEAPLTLRIPDRGLLRVTDPAGLAAALVMRLYIAYSEIPDPGGAWSWRPEHYVDALRAIGCVVRVEHDNLQ